MLTALNSATSTAVVPPSQDRRYLYLENTGVVDVRWGWDATVTMSGATMGALLKAGQIREFAADTFGPIGKPIFAIAASGTPSLLWLEASN